MTRPKNGQWSRYYGDDQTYPCGHPRTPENTQHVGMGNGVRCKTCRREISKRSAIKRRRELAALEETA
jgi:hypothetical protein